MDASDISITLCTQEAGTQEAARQGICVSLVDRRKAGKIHIAELLGPVRLGTKKGWDLKDSPESEKCAL